MLVPDRQTDRRTNIVAIAQRFVLTNASLGVSTTRIIRLLPHRVVNFYTVNRKKTKMFLSYLPQNPTDSDKIWYTSSRINLYTSLFTQNSVDTKQTKSKQTSEAQRQHQMHTHQSIKHNLSTSKTTKEICIDSIIRNWHTVLMPTPNCTKMSYNCRRASFANNVHRLFCHTVVQTFYTLPE